MKSFLIIFVVIFLFSCSTEEKPEKKDWSQINNQLVDINKYLVKEDQERIQSYIKRNNWEMQQTETGLWYEIFGEGEGEFVKEDDIVVINYQVELLDGTICYSSDSLGSLTFKVGMGNTESGIQEGILLMKKGNKARFILPPYLAHGLLGDENKIPTRSIIVYYIDLIKLN